MSDATADMSLQESCKDAARHLSAEVHLLAAKANRLEQENAKLRKVAKMMLLVLKDRGIYGGAFVYPDRNSNAEEWVNFESYLRELGIEV